jgi:hypothetical protein
VEDVYMVSEVGERWWSKFDVLQVVLKGYDDRKEWNSIVEKSK